jgi:hypothetical protein
MINFRASGIAAGTAFILSLVIGVISGTAFPAMLLRAFIFAIVFFVLSGLGFWLVSRYLPELLNGGEGVENGGVDDLGMPVSGSRVDISIGETSIDGAFPEDVSDAMDDISESPFSGTGATGYVADSSTAGSYDTASSHEPMSSQAVFSPLDHEKNTGYNQKRDFSDDTGNLIKPETLGEARAEALPDMNNLGEGFTEGGQSIEVESFEPPEPRRSSPKKPAMADDFDPKELAKAIQTVLKKDDKG